MGKCTWPSLHRACAQRLWVPPTGRAPDGSHRAANGAHIPNGTLTLHTQWYTQTHTSCGLNGTLTQWYTHTMVHSHERAVRDTLRSQWLSLSCSHTDAHGRHANVGSWLLGSFALLRCELRGALKCSYSGNFTISGSARSRGRCQSRSPVGRSVAGRT